MMYLAGVQNQTYVLCRARRDAGLPGEEIATKCIDGLQTRHPLCRPPSPVAYELQASQDVQEKCAALPFVPCGLQCTGESPAAQVELWYNLLHTDRGNDQVHGHKHT